MPLLLLVYKLFNQLGRPLTQSRILAHETPNQLKFLAQLRSPAYKMLN